MSAVLQAAPEPEDGAEQLAWVDGFPAAGQRFTLKSVANLWTDRKLAFGDIVKFAGTGSVSGVHTFKTKDGVLFYVYEIEANDADLVD